VSARLTPRERRLIDAALDAFATSIAVTVVDNGVEPQSCAAAAAEVYDELGRFLAKLGRVAPDARRYAHARFERLVRETGRTLGLDAR